MKSYATDLRDAYAQSQSRLGAQMPGGASGALCLVSAHDLAALKAALERKHVPEDFEAKLNKLAGGGLLHRAVEQNCRLFIGLIHAANEGTFRQVTKAEKERLLRVLAYVRKDDDAIPDYKTNGFMDDQREVRAAATELSALLEAFKSWRLRFQVPEMWRRGDGMTE
jgi:hypothetical protein